MAQNTFIEVIHNNEFILINTDNITSIIPRKKDGCIVWFINSEDYLMLEDSYSSIKEKLKDIVAIWPN